MAVNSYEDDVRSERAVSRRLLGQAIESRVLTIKSPTGEISISLDFYKKVEIFKREKPATCTNSSHLFFLVPHTKVI